MRHAQSVESQVQMSDFRNPNSGDPAKALNPLRIRPLSGHQRSKTLGITSGERCKWGACMLRAPQVEPPVVQGQELEVCDYLRATFLIHSGGFTSVNHLRRDEVFQATLCIGN